MVSTVKIPTTKFEINCISTATHNPKLIEIIIAYFNVFVARSSFPAPIFCAAIAETADSIEDGTKNTKLMIFSTIPTAAASFNPFDLQ